LAAARGRHPASSRTGCGASKPSTDPAFVAELRYVVGLYLDPPAHRLVLSVDERSQIQALDRTQPGLPIKKAGAGTMTHDYVRHGTMTLFAVLNVLDGSVTRQYIAQHRQQKFIRFLNAVERPVPFGKLNHCSSVNAVTTFFDNRRHLQRGAFHSLVDRRGAINRYLAEHNQRPKPFV
jgi:hypothetical protein